MGNNTAFWIFLNLSYPSSLYSLSIIFVRKVRALFISQTILHWHHCISSQASEQIQKSDKFTASQLFDFIFFPNNKTSSQHLQLTGWLGGVCGEGELICCCCCCCCHCCCCDPTVPAIIKKKIWGEFLRATAARWLN